jgi:thiamine biosynthesis lipoprotein
MVVENIYREKEKVISRFDKKSELTKLNDNLGVFYPVSKDILYLAKKYLIYYKESDGIFDPRILDTLEKIGYKEDFKKNTFLENNIDLNQNIFNKSLENDLILDNEEVKFNKRMDFAGLAKGYITDKVANFLISKGWENFLVDSGGDMYASGKNRYDRKWGIALEGSQNEDKIMLEISNQGLATSGNTRKTWKIGDKKVHHLINPEKLDDFNFDIKTVTVVAENTELADAWAKVLFLMDIERGIEWANKKEIRCIFLKNDKNIIKSKLIS